MMPIRSLPRVLQAQARIVLCSVAVAAMVACAPPADPASRTKEAWNEYNDPSLFSLQIMKLEDLPKKGELADDKIPWSDSYWPTYAGGLSWRWQERSSSENYRRYLYKPLKPDELNSVDIAKLSPAEKFDLFLDRYDFPLVRYEQRRTREAVDSDTGKVPDWFGLCHGWAVASLLEKEPGAVAVVKNHHGLEIPFYSSDIGALMTHIYAFSSDGGRFMGTRCDASEHDIKVDENDRIILPECRDLNPGSFHLALTQMLGLPERGERQAFIMDLVYSDEVWNHPVIAYEVKSLKVEDYDASDDALAAYRAEGTRQLARVKMKVSYVDDSLPHKRPQREQPIATETYSYTLELDGSGRIIGGEWNEETHPDFMWMVGEQSAGSTLVPRAEVAKLLDLSRNGNHAE